MKIEEAIKRLQELIEYKEEWMEFWKEKGKTDYRLHDTELDLEMLHMAVWALTNGMCWIPCSKRMPEMHEFTYCTDDETVKSSSVVVFCDRNSVHTGYYESIEGTAVRARWYTEDGEPCDGVTAWMPLPEVYEED